MKPYRHVTYHTPTSAASKEGPFGEVLELFTSVLVHGAPRCHLYAHPRPTKQTLVVQRRRKIFEDSFKLRDLECYHLEMRCSQTVANI
ncbi:hypothetical protein PROFUN_09256 [Planoprotostelium fungivorum]|uniref:Uncharacterized protein n=1 Tax=Planoprotostelium fungivorum TaxID=1890364 RepID=A0A2P6NKV4_9EUKA|nr:hypothetical protein PROFUN_09256 [Planoprotostelium fungivorum]